MNKTGRTKHKRGRAVLLGLLALGCIAGAELAACRFFDPGLYSRLTAPVRQGAAAVLAAGRQTAGLARQLWAGLAPEAGPAAGDGPAPEPEAGPAPAAGSASEPLTESQLAAEPQLASDLPIADPAVTELKDEDGVQRLTGNGISTVYFNQGQEPWASQPYGSDDIGGYGCGPTALSMAVSSLTDAIVDPAVMAEWAYENGYWASGSGSYLSIVQGTAQAYGLKSQSLSEHTPEALRDALLSGKLVVALMGPGHFTQNGHFILLRGITLSGSVLVADPNSTERSLMEWDPQLILDELSGNTASGGPLWAIWAPGDAA